MSFWTIPRVLFLSHFLAVLLVSGSVGTYFYHSASQSLMAGLQERLRNSAALVSVKLDAEMLDSIRSGPDIDSETYSQVLGLLRDFRRTNPDIAYLYVMRKVGESVQFVVDSDYTEAQARPGDPYEAVVPALLLGFQQPSADDRIHEDAWGVFLSGYAPVEGGRGAYLVGIDMRADEVAAKFRQLRVSGLFSLLISVALALVFSQILAHRFTHPITRLVAQCRAIAQGRLEGRLEDRARDEIDDLIRAFNAMSGKLAESQREHLRAHDELRQARDTLEVAVSQRTAELQDVNARLLAEAEEHARVREALNETARMDPLTGLPNRRAMDERLTHESTRAARHSRPFCLLLGDIDHFKLINDRYGHMTGDLVLRELAAVIRNAVRGEDMVARWGGEEFLMLLPDTDREGGRIAAEKIRQILADKVFLSEDLAITATISIGVADSLQAPDTKTLIRLADDAMYSAKAAGRNRVRVAGET